MARNLALSFLLVLAGIAVWFALRADPAVERTVVPGEAALETAHIEAARLADDPVDRPREVEAAPASTPATPGPTAESARETVLIVHVLAQETGLPRAGVDVNVRDPSVERWAWKPVERTRGALGESPMTAAEGVVEIEVPPGRALSVSTSSRDRSTSRAVLEVEPLGPGEHRDVTLRVLTQCDREFHGRVVASETKHALGGVQILEGGRKVARTDSDGRFTMAWASWDQRMLETAADGYAPSCFFPLEEANSIANELTLELRRGATLTVTLAGLPAGATSSCMLLLTTPVYQIVDRSERRSWRPGMVSDRRWTARFDERGHATLEDLPPEVPLSVRVVQGPSNVHVEGSPLVLGQGEQREVTWTVGAGCRVTVNASEDTKPVPDLTFCLLHGDGRASYLHPYEEKQAVKRAVTDAEGHAVFEDVDAGEWKLALVATAVRGGGADPTAIAPAPVLFVVSAGEREQALEYSVQRGHSIQGRVLEPDGKPAAHGRVSGLNERGADLDTAIEPDGRFVLGPLLEGRYAVQATDFTRFLPSKRIDVASDARDLELRLAPASKLSGRVVDGTTGDGRSATVSMARDRRPGQARSSSMETETQPDGTFHLDAIEPGVYCLCARSEDGRVGIARGVKVELEHPAEGVVIQLAPGGRLTVRYEGRADWGTASVYVGPDQIACDSVKPGTSLEVLAPPGPVRVEFLARGASAPLHEDAVIVVGEQREVVLRD